MSVRRCLLFSAFVFVLLSAWALASAQQTSRYFLAAGERWEVGVWGGEAFGKTASQTFGESQITMAGFRAGHVIYQSPDGSEHRRSLAYTIELQPLFFVTRPQTVYGGGFSPVGLQWNFAPRGHGRFRPYLEFHGGGMFTQKNVPPGRTDTFNFTISTGPGVMIALKPKQALSVSLDYWHLSNASLGHDNPAFNTIELVVGYHWLVGKGAGHRQARSPQPGEARPSARTGHPAIDAQ
ncbi:MAG TPA: acyloxyacyl hydrolase [Bryobacteraceae bacterium]|jgi:hypothetical protein